MTEAGVENQAVSPFILAKSGIVSQEHVRVHTLFRVLQTVAIVEGDTAAHVRMPAAVGLRRRQDIPFHVFVV